MQETFKKLTQSPYFEKFIIGVILANAVLIGLETVPEIASQWGFQLNAAYQAILLIFILEALAKMLALAPRFWKYFENEWNIFDFTIIVLSLIPGSGSFATVARLVRILRVLRLVSVLPTLRMLVSTLLHSLPKMGGILLLLALIFYIYAVIGYHFFHENDPEKWGSLAASLLTLTQIATLDDWSSVMQNALSLSGWFWIYFVSFVIITTFVVVNLFIAIILSSLDEVRKNEFLEAMALPTQKELLNEIRQAKSALEKLEARLKKEKK